MKEPGEIGDPDHGLPGPAEPLPKDDHDRDDTPTEVNDEDEED